MSDIVFLIRLYACVLWFWCGMISGTPMGHASALASSMFFTASLLERYDQKKPKRKKK